MYMTKIGIVGIGFVGNAMYETFKRKKLQDIKIYDKYKNGGIGNLEDCLDTDIIFLALPTLYDSEKCQYDKTAIIKTCEFLNKNNYSGIVIIKSTVEPETTEKLNMQFNQLHIIHNPEFLTAKTAIEDFYNQTHIVLGKSSICSNNKLDILANFYKEYFPKAEISMCTSIESESMKIFCNSFYATKIQFFTEIYLLCQKNGCNFDIVKSLMLKNNWINPMHTTVPGPDGNISFGGMCFPKDISALLSYMKINESPSKVIQSVIEENKEMRE